MSWLSNITGKAEEFLNKIDQSAAQALHKEEEEQRLNLSLPLTREVTSLGSPPSSSRDHNVDRAAYSVPSKTTFKKDNSASSFVSTPIKANKAAPLVGSSGVAKQTGKVTVKPPADSVTKQASSTGPQGAGTQEQKTSSASAPAKKKLDTDEALFDFLNSSEPLEANKKKAAPPPSVVDPPRHSRQSSTSSVVSNKGGKSNADTPVSTSGSSIVHVDALPLDSDRGSPSEPDGSADVLALADAMMEQSPSNSVSSNQDGDHSAELNQKISSLELENKLLKNEVASLNQEMATVLQRSKDSQSGNL
ncbi:hypothetical protein FSP39_014263 [Pinctada imbricata]|uniref:Golgin-84 n=1 Tax=Pinctada imbricata TaxID=66713 RepID=A0AA89BZE6_PINIB|nr:hypothetical protein FSP39_014263 [Pinctada imbricata]